ncbi:MAG: arcB 2 [Gammaproteobacteria bacterium]|jgi:PAS domain S-box-containing protein|nr:arcB 2 [Gammaproteobacteria bacterium]
MSNEVQRLKQALAQREADLQTLHQQFSQLKQQADITNTYLTNILVNFPEHIYWIDAEGKILNCNEMQAHAFGYSCAKEVVGKTIYDIAEHLGWDKHIPEKIRQSDAEVMQTKCAKTFEISVSINGKQITYIDHKKPLIDKNGQVIGVVGIGIDITRRKQIEKDLKQGAKKALHEKMLANIYLDNILACIPEHLYWLDKNGVILGCNDKQAQAFGASNREAVIGKDIFDVGRELGWPAEMVSAIRQNDLMIMETKQPVVAEESGIFHGEYKTYISYKNPLLDEKNEVMGIFGITVDITERKKMERELLKAKEKAELASQAKSEFLMNMSHDIRTPLNGILGFSQLLEAQEIDPTKKENLGYILQSTRRLIKLLNEILDTSYIEEGMPLEFIEFNSRDLFNDLAELMQSELRRKNLELVLEYGENVPTKLMGDKKRLDKILINLLSNAVKFTEAGTITISVSVLENTNTAVNLKIAVKDMGIGIPQDKFEVIYDKFTRLTSSYRGVYLGSGLGLYIVKRFVNDLNGKLEVESELGKGSTFTCILPLTKL